MSSKISLFARNGRRVTKTKQNLNELFHRFNEEHFNSALDRGKIDVSWSTRLRVSAGYCRYRFNGRLYLPHSIELSEKLFANVNYDQAEVEETLIHEMAHAFCAINWHVTGHGWRFQKTMADIMQDGRDDYTYHNLDVTGLRNKSRRWY